MPIPVSDAVVDAVVARLGPARWSDGELARIRTATQFLVQVMGIDDPSDIASYIEGIDLHFPVEARDLLPDTPLIGYRYNPTARFAALDPFGMFFTDPGVSKHTLGIPTDDRRYIRLEVRTRVRALVSRAKSGYVGFFRNLVPHGVVGGSTQYIIPQASLHLRVRHIQHAIR